MRTGLGRVFTLLPFIFVLLSSVTYAVVVETENIYSIQDTSTNSYQPTYWLNDSSDRGGLGMEYIGSCRYMRSYFEFSPNITAFPDKILEQVLINFSLQSGAYTVPYVNETTGVYQASVPHGAFYSNISIVENFTGVNLSWNNKPSPIQYTSIYDFFINESVGVPAQRFIGEKDITDITQIKNITYHHINESINLGVFPNELTAGGCDYFQATSYYRTSEGTGLQPKLIFKWADFYTAKITGTDTTYTYFDFETYTTDSITFPEADFYYDAVSDKLIMLGDTVATFYGREGSNDNTLSEIPCTVDAYAPSEQMNFSVTNQPLGYSIYCFNISESFGGRQYAGAIKIINNTNVRGGINNEFDFFYALYSPDWLEIYNVQHSPQSPIINQSVVVTWKTTLEADSTLYFRMRESGNDSYSSWGTIENLTESVLSHSLTINGSEFIRDNFFYQYYVESASVTETNDGNYYNFTVGGFYEIDFPPNYTTPEHGWNITDNTGIAITNLERNTGVDAIIWLYLMAFLIIAFCSGAGFLLGNSGLGFGIFITLVFIFTLFHWLPSWIIMPFILVTGLILAKLISKVFS